MINILRNRKCMIYEIHDKEDLYNKHVQLNKVLRI